MCMSVVRPLSPTGLPSMSASGSNGNGVVQGQLDIDLGERWVEAGGEPIPLTAALESLLFVAAEPVDPAELARSLGLDHTIIVEGLSVLAQHYTRYSRGL